MPAYHFPLLVWQGSTARRTPATLTAALSHDTAAPLKLVLTGDEDLMLYFTASVSETAISEMCSKLLLKKMTPAGLVERLGSVVENPPDCRSIAIAPDGSGGPGGAYRFVVSDELGERTLPHISLPFVKEGPLVIARHLAEIVRKSRDGLEMKDDELKQLRERAGQAELAATEKLTAQQLEISRLQASNTELSQKLTQAEAERDGFQRSLADSRHTLETQITGLSSANSDLSLKIETLEENLRVAEESAQNKSLRCDELESRLREAEKQAATSAETLESIRGQLRSTEAELKSLQLEHVDLKARAESMRDRLSLAEDRASKSSEMLASEKASLAKDFADMQHMTEALTTELQGLRGTLASTVAERDRLQAELSNAVQALNDAVTRGESLAAELDELGGSRDALASQLRSESAKATQALAALRCAGEKCEGLESECRQLRKDNAVLRERLNYAEQQNGRDIANYFTKGVSKARKPPRPNSLDDSREGDRVDLLALLRANEEARAKATAGKAPSGVPGTQGHQRSQLTKYATGLPDYVSAVSAVSTVSTVSTGAGSRGSAPSAPLPFPDQSRGSGQAAVAGADLTESSLDAIPSPRAGGERAAPAPQAGAPAAVPASPSAASSGSSGFGLPSSVAGSVLLSPGTRKLVAKYMRQDSGSRHSQPAKGEVQGGYTSVSSTSPSRSSPLLDSALAAMRVVSPANASPSGPTNPVEGAVRVSSAGPQRAAKPAPGVSETTTASAVDPYMERFRQMLAEDLS